MRHLTAKTVRTLVGPLATWAVAVPAAAAPTQEDVFKSIQHNVGGGGGEVDGTMFLYVVFGLIALVALLAFAGRQRSTRAAAPKARNHQGKLLREVLKAVPLKAKELKQLKALAENATDVDGPIASPLTLLLCPSVMARTIQGSKRVKFDRRALVSVARKAGLQVAKR